METVLQEATSTPSPAMPVQQGDGSQLDMLLDRITSPYVVQLSFLCLLLSLMVMMMMMMMMMMTINVVDGNSIWLLSAISVVLMTRKGIMMIKTK